MSQIEVSMATAATGPKYRALVAEAKPRKRVHHLRSTREMSAFLDAVKIERVQP